MRKLLQHLQLQLIHILKNMRIVDAQEMEQEMLMNSLELHYKLVKLNVILARHVTIYFITVEKEALALIILESVNILKTLMEEKSSIKF